MLHRLPAQHFKGLEALEPRQLLAAQPTLAPLSDQPMLAGSPLLVPLTGLTPKAKGKISARTSQKQVKAQVVSTGLSLRIDVAGFGSMTFALFDKLAPKTVRQIATLARQGFYDGVIFHRIINNFVIQGGDPTGTGAGGSSLPDLDDEFSVDLQHNASGLLSMAKSGDDTGNSQFFITEGPARHLDFNHTIFGKLVAGEDVREAISNVAVDSSDRPITPVTMTRVTVFKDKRNAMLMIKADEGFDGSANVRVTVQNRNNPQQRVQRSFLVNVSPDTVNGGPFLSTIVAPKKVEAGKAFTIRLSAIDPEGDPVVFGAINNSPNIQVTGRINPSTGLVRVKPSKGSKGILQLLVRVAAANGSDTQDQWDSQLLRIKVR